MARSAGSRRIRLGPRAEACLSFSAWRIWRSGGWRTSQCWRQRGADKRGGTKQASRCRRLAEAGNREAEAVVTASWDAAALRHSLGGVKALTWSKDPAFSCPGCETCLPWPGSRWSSCGGSRMSASAPLCPVTRSAMIAVSGRFLADDQFWYTVTHELAHLLLHHPITRSWTTRRLPAGLTLPRTGS